MVKVNNVLVGMAVKSYWVPALIKEEAVNIGLLEAEFKVYISAESKISKRIVKNNIYNL